MRMQTSIIALLGLALAACGGADESATPDQSEGVETETSESEDDTSKAPAEAG